MLEARPTLELIMQQWEQVPHQQRRELFEAFARRIIVDKMNEVQRKLVIEWRDGTTSEMTFRTGRQRHYLTKKERKKLVRMIRNQHPQWEILREFPKLSWQKIALRFYRDGEVDGVPGRIGQVYQQPLKYTYQQSWADTEEYQQSLQLCRVVAIFKTLPLNRIQSPLI